MSVPIRQEGGCRCDAVRFAVIGAPLLTFACHCIGCQHMSASAFSLSSLYPAERFAVTNGETVLGGLKGATRHHFCASCMSWLFTVPEGMDELVNIRSTMFDDSSTHRPFIDAWLSEGVSWVDSGATRKFDSIPAEDEFPQLMADYAEWDGRVQA
jgi:hypothetical protein